jgi:quinol monooxygenase YgiN
MQMTAQRVRIIVNGTFEIAPADQPRFIAIVKGHLEETRREVSGCIYYSVALDIECPVRMHLIEGWSDRPALERHLASPRLQVLRARLHTVPMNNYQTFIYSVSDQEQYFPTAPSAN